VSKLANLYYLCSKNVLSIFLLNICLINSSFSFDLKNTDNQIKTIVIDPGHGGKDPGTLGTKRYNIYEKHVALSVSLKLGKLISNNFPNIKIIYTRKEDVFLSLKKRTEIANNANADLFISIHCDGFTNSSVSGSSVFVMGMSKLKANLDVAMRENSAIYLEDNYKQNYEGFDPSSPESYIVFSLMQNTYLDQSLQFAEEVEKKLSSKNKSRGVKQAPFYVISRTNMPSVLIECGFLTNPSEEDYLHSKSGQDSLSLAIFNAFCNYKESLGNFEVKKDALIVSDTLVNNQKNVETSFKANNDKEINNKLKEIVFKVQIGTYLKSMLSLPLFKEINAEEVVIESTYKYYVGSSHRRNEIDQVKIDMKKRGFKDAFVVAFYKGNKISTSEALILQNKILNNEE